jgi:hypothetical protein
VNFCGNYVNVSRGTICNTFATEYHGVTVTVEVPPQTKIPRPIRPRDSNYEYEKKLTCQVVLVLFELQVSTLFDSQTNELIGGKTNFIGVVVKDTFLRVVVQGHVDLG